MTAAYPTFRQWVAGGQRLSIELPSPGGSRRVEVFTRVEGQGPWLTFLHGFPTSSMDWARVLPLISHRFRVLCFDFPGFGDSDKPTDLDYSIVGQANCVEALWRQLGITSSFLVVHDLGSTIGVEILYRLAQGTLCAEIPRMIIMNSAIYPEAYRPLISQRLLLNPVTGPLFSRLVSWSIFRRQYSSVFSKNRVPSDGELAEHWEAVVHRRGKRNFHHCIQYINERIRQRERWEPVVEKTKVPIRYVWGMLDPIEGAIMLDVMKRRMPALDVREIADVGHVPQLEVPEIVAEEILKLLA